MKITVKKRIIKLMSIIISVFLIANVFTISKINSPKAYARPLSVTAQDLISYEVDSLWRFCHEGDQDLQYSSLSSKRWREYYIIPDINDLYYADCSSFIDIVFKRANISTINNLITNELISGQNNKYQPWRTEDFRDDLKKPASTRKFTEKQKVEAPATNTQVISTKKIDVSQLILTRSKSIDY